MSSFLSVVVIPMLNSALLFSGFAVVLAEDVPDVPSQQITTGGLSTNFFVPKLIDDSLSY